MKAFVIFKGKLSSNRWHGGAVVSTAAAQQEGPKFDSLSWQGPFVWSLHVLLVLPGYSSFLQQSKDMQHNRLIGDSKLPIVSGCLSL